MSDKWSRSRRGTRTAAAALPLLMALVLGTGACGGSSSTPTSTTVRFWAPGIIAVALALPSRKAPPANTVAMVQNLFPAGSVVPSSVPLGGGPQDHPEEGIPPLIVIDRSATVFFQLQSGGKDDNSDTDLKKAIDNFNALDHSKPVVPDVWAVGASPDWNMLGGSGGSGNIGGSPGGVPTANSQTPPAPKGSPCQSGSPSSPSTYVFVLDTAYPFGPVPDFDHQTHKLRTARLCDPTAADGSVNIQDALNPGGSTASPSGSIPADARARNNLCQGSCNLLYDLDTSSFATSPLETDTVLYDENAQVAAYAKMGGYDSPLGHQYSFQAHGPFIAELIHHLAPAAQVNLIRVLDDSGAGDMRTLIWALQQVWAYPTGNATVIVNLSLAVEPPPGCLLQLWESDFSDSGSYPANELAKCNSNNPSLPQARRDGEPNFDDTNPRFRVFLPLGLAVRDLATDGVSVVAAAGNDSTPNQRLGADMPAAFCSVTAVASLDSAGQLAPYSNLPTLLNVAGQGGQCLTTPLGFCAPQPQVGSSCMGCDVSNAACFYCNTDVSGGHNQCNPCTDGSRCHSTCATNQVPCVPCSLDDPVSPVILSDGSQLQGSSVQACIPIAATRTAVWLAQQSSNTSATALGDNLCSLDLYSPTGAAIWSGTSFAAAMVSGNLAANGGAQQSPLCS